MQSKITIANNSMSKDWSVHNQRLKRCRDEMEVEMQELKKRFKITCDSYETETKKIIDTLQQLTTEYKRIDENLKREEQLLKLKHQTTFDELKNTVNVDMTELETTIVKMNKDNQALKELHTILESKKDIF